MLQCPNSIFVFFPEDVYRNVSSSDVLPQLLECLPSEKVAAVQFLRGGVVRITFTDEAVSNDVLARGISFQGSLLRVVCASSEVRSLYVRDLPVEVSDDVVSAFLSSYGDVVLVSCSTYKDFPSVRDGNRVVRIILKQDVPSFVRIADCNCRVWYNRQPVQCAICRETGHVARDCSLSGRCRRCHQRGHVARSCTQAWGPSRAPNDGDQPVIDTNDDDDDDDDDANTDDNGESNAVPAAMDDQPSVVEPPVAFSESAVPPLPDPVRSAESPAPESSKRSSKLNELRVAAASNSELRRLLRVIGHVVTESVLGQIDAPMNSMMFFTSLIRLTKGKLNNKQQQYVRIHFPFACLPN